MKKKGLALVLALALLVIGVVGGTLAWLTSTSDEVVNTFTASDITVTLTETKNNFQMIPGYTIDKDPTVTVKANSEKCYLFVKLEKSENFDSYLTYEMAASWTALTGVDGVYYCVVDQATTDTTFSVLKDNKVSVKGEVTKAMMATAETSKPTLKVTAYASQYMKNNTEAFTPAEAWANVPTTTTNP